jgi:LmbE family N-acetylglucosaminyl deacetylase
MATVVAFHAHPDDEVLLTGGTLAKLAAEGHRVVIVVACAGGLGTGASPSPGPGWLCC